MSTVSTVGRVPVCSINSHYLKNESLHTLDICRCSFKYHPLHYNYTYNTLDLPFLGWIELQESITTVVFALTRPSVAVCALSYCTSMQCIGSAAGMCAQADIISRGLAGRVRNGD